QLRCFDQFLQQFIGALWIDLATGSSQYLRDVLEHLPPCLRSHLTRRKLHEFIAQKNHSQQVLKQNAFLLYQVARSDKLIEVSAMLEQITHRPHRRNKQSSCMV